ncbi:hypothetical protein CEP54_015242 [Fusarium duplospermum]|uniref:Epoxide hydrolase N-terminal domain-containing protein n=1 Tax=Fusarium duplospermum TaxID=1325734 RepID=A0A428NQH3_9HYPO|nr:hypothetical protein CEP54_015242 [Fusarium duplospermum]
MADSSPTPVPHQIPASVNLRPFSVSVPQPRIDNLRTLLSTSPVPPPNYENSRSDGSYGVTRDWVVAALEYWKKTYDWHHWEGVLNTIPQFQMEIEDDDSSRYDAHFMAIFSENPKAIPLLFLHGWPGSVVEFLPLLLHLKSQFDANPADFCYHIIVPSLVGFGWSSPPPNTKDFRFEENARLLSKLMANLGFSKTGYVVQGGDIGSPIACSLADQDPACKLVHVNLFVMSPPEGFDESRMHQFSEEELTGLQRGKNFWTNGTAYALIQKMIEWSDQTPTLDLILTNVCLYWFSGCLPTSLWSYRQMMSGGNPSTGWEHVNAPMGFSAFKYESGNPPKAWIDTTGKVKWYRWHAEGGHFAALERPMGLWGDVVEFIESMDMFS